MAGYIFSPRPYAAVTEVTLVGCRNCEFAWAEPYTHYSPVRIRGPMFLYDACAKCYDPVTNNYFEGTAVLLNDILSKGEAMCHRCRSTFYTHREPELFPTWTCPACKEREDAEVPDGC